MFFMRDGKWNMFPKKITYKEIKVVYDMDDTAIKSNPKYTDVVVTDFTLTPEQYARLELVRDATNATIEDIGKFVFNETIMHDSQEYIEGVVNNAKKRVRLEYMVRWDEVMPEQMAEMIGDYEKWEPNATYIANKILQYKGKLYKVILGHPSYAHFPPDTTTTLYYAISPEVVIAPWEQRYGHNPYMPGDKVIWKDIVYECIASTTYSPTDWARAWKKS